MDGSMWHGTSVTINIQCLYIYIYIYIYIYLKIIILISLSICLCLYLSVSCTPHPPTAELTRSHFGGGGGLLRRAGEGPRAKSRQELIEELIQKSKHDKVAQPGVLLHMFV